MPIPADFPTAERTSQRYPGGVPRLPLTALTPKEAIAEDPNVPQTDAPIAKVLFPRSGSIRQPDILEPNVRSLRDLFVSDGQQQFEVGADVASSFVTPADATNLMPLNFRVHFAYNLDDRNQVGVRVARSPFSSIVTTQGMGYVDAAESTTQQMSEELFYEHRFPVDGGLFSISLGAGGGLFNNGWLAGPEAGIRIPISARMLFGASFLLSYVHQTHTALDDVTGPVIYDGKGVQNTLVGRIEYGLSYRF